MSDLADEVCSLRSVELLRICYAGKLDAVLKNGIWYVNCDHLLALVNAKDAIDTTLRGDPIFAFIITKCLSDSKDEKRFQALFQLPEVGVVYAIESANFPGMLKIGKTMKPMKVRLSCINCAIPSNPFCMVDKFKTFNCAVSERNAHNRFHAQHESKEIFRLTHDELRCYFTLQKQAFQKEALMRSLTVRVNRAKADAFDMWRESAAKTLAAKMFGDAVDGVRLEEVPSLLMKLPGTMRKPTRAKLCAHFEVLVTSLQQSSGTKRRYENVSVDEPDAKRANLAGSQESPQAIHVARNNEIIFDAFQKYMEIQERAQDPKARSTFSEMLMNNTQTLLATPAIDKPQPEPGYIYCLQSNRYPDEVKIGRAKKIKPRIYKINKEYRDQNEDIVLTYRYSVRTLDYKRDEKLAHDYFASVREPCKGELFRTTPEKVRDFFEREIRPRYHQECATDVDMDEGEEEDMDIEI